MNFNPEITIFIYMLGFLVEVFFALLLRSKKTQVSVVVVITVVVMGLAVLAFIRQTDF